MNSAFITPNTLMISVPITASNGQTKAAYLFPPQQELQDRKVIGIESYCVIDSTYDPLNPGNTVLDVTTFAAGFATIYKSAVPNKATPGDQQEPGLFYDKIPLARLRVCQNNTPGIFPLPSFTKDIFRIVPTEIAYQKCKVEFPTSIVIQDNMSAVFLFHYLDINANPKDYM